MPTTPLHGHSTSARVSLPLRRLRRQKSVTIGCTRVEMYPLHDTSLAAQTCRLASAVEANGTTLLGPALQVACRAECSPHTHLPPPFLLRLLPPLLRTLLLLLRSTTCLLHRLVALLRQQANLPLCAVQLLPQVGVVALRALQASSQRLDLDLQPAPRGAVLRVLRCSVRARFGCLGHGVDRSL